MRRFIYDCSCYNKQLPSEFHEDFSDLFLFTRFSSEIHQHDIANSRPLTSSSDLNCLSLKLPSVSKTSVLPTNDFEHLKTTYATMLQCDVQDIQMTRSIKVFKNITLYGQFIGSIKHPQTKHSAYIRTSSMDRFKW